jgi:hypothetical protein
MTPCERCDFFGHACQPCPLEFRDDRQVPQCLWAEQEERRMHEQLLRQRVKPATGFACDTATLAHPDGRSLDVGSMIAAIVDQSATTSTPIEEILAHGFDEPLSQPERCSIVETLSDLVALRFLETT